MLDVTTKRIGLRTLELDRHKDQWGESFQFVVNGIPFFAKGANWIPADALFPRINKAVYRKIAALSLNSVQTSGVFKAAEHAWMGGTGTLHVGERKSPSGTVLIIR